MAGIPISHEEDMELSQSRETSKINISTIHDVVRARFGDKFVKNIHIMDFSVGYSDEYG